MTQETELPIIDRTYQLLKWYLGHVSKFPRSHRFTLGARMETAVCDVLEGLVQARYVGGASRGVTLHQTNGKLQSLRLFTRLAVDLRLIPLKSYEYAARELVEIGKMLGGWLRHQKQSDSSNN